MKLYLLAITILLSLSAPAQVDNATLRSIEKLVTEEKYEEALQKFLAFHEDSKNSPGMGGVRLSFALVEWAKLGKKYPKAQAALVEIADGHEKGLLAGTAGYGEFSEYSAIYQYLEQPDKAGQLFKQLDAKHLRIAETCFIAMEDVLFEKGDYEICGRYIKDPVFAFERERYMRESNLSAFKTGQLHKDKQIEDFTENRFLNKTCQLIELMVKLNRMAEAEEIHKRALAYYDHPRIKEALAVAKEKK